MKLTVVFTVLLVCSLGFTVSADEVVDEEPLESDLVQRVVVTASRADEDSAATFTNISREMIDEAFYAQDVPVLLSLAPSVYSYSDSGNGVGYSYLSIRGFDQRRVAVTINGVPLNDAESHQVYWIDLPNFPASLEDIQIQRGAGTSVYGGNAIGGTINLETTRFSPGAGISFDLGYGSYGTAKASFAWNSNLVAERWLFGARFSQIESDGYRDKSWSELQSGFFSAQRIGDKSLLRINLYGGVEETHLAYEGLTREQLEVDRKQNPLDWDGEIDHFTQPHLELIHEYLPGDQLKIANTVYYFYGDGYFDQFREMKLFSEVRLDDWDWDGDDTIDSAGPLFRKRKVTEWDLGWAPSVSYKHGRGTVTGGASIRLHEGEHYGRVTGAVDPDIPQPYNYYQYEIPKTSTVLYVQDEWQATEAIQLVAGLQYVSNSWKLEKDQVTGYSYDVDYSWFAPRAGVTYRFNKQLSGFLTASHSRREPAVTDLYNPSDIYTPPAFADMALDGTLSNPLVEEEKLNDFEMGLSYAAPTFAFKATLYDMEFEDELVATGQQNDLGEAITGNAARSVHRGIELEGTVHPVRDIEISGNVMYSDDHLKDFVLQVFDWDTGLVNPVDYSGNRIAFFPNVLARLGLSWNQPWGRIGISGSHTGRIYIDNSETKEISIDPFTVVDLSARYDLPFGRDDSYSLRLQVNNLFDHEYESFGYSYGTPVFIPAAGRHMFLMLSFKQAP